MKKIHGWIPKSAVLPLLFIGFNACSSAPKSEDKPAVVKTSIDDAVELAKERDQLREENQRLAVQLDELKSKVLVLEQQAKKSSEPERPLPPATLVQPKGALAFKGKTPSRISSASFINNEVTDRFREALILYQAKKYPDAIVELKEFVKNFGDHALAPRAQYLAGMAYYKQNEYGLAAEEWNTALIAFPNSAVIAETLSGLVSTSKALGLKDEGIYYENKLNSRFPHARLKNPLVKLPSPTPTPASGQTGAAPGGATKEAPASSTVTPAGAAEKSPESKPEKSTAPVEPSKPVAPVPPTAPPAASEASVKNPEPKNLGNNKALDSAPINFDEGEPE